MDTEKLLCRLKKNDLTGAERYACLEKKLHIQENIMHRSEKTSRPLRKMFLGAEYFVLGRAGESFWAWDILFLDVQENILGCRTFCFLTHKKMLLAGQDFCAA